MFVTNRTFYYNFSSNLNEVSRIIGTCFVSLFSFMLCDLLVSMLYFSQLANVGLDLVKI